MMGWYQAKSLICYACQAADSHRADIRRDTQKAGEANAWGRLTYVVERD